MSKQAAARIEPVILDDPARSISPEVSEVLHLIGTLERLAYSTAAQTRSPGSARED